MVTLMQCIHDTVYTLEHPCYATLPFPISSIKKKTLKKRKKQTKKRIYRFDRKKTDLRFGLYSKKYMT